MFRHTLGLASFHLVDLFPVMWMFSAYVSNFETLDNIVFKSIIYRFWEFLDIALSRSSLIHGFFYRALAG